MKKFYAIFITTSIILFLLWFTNESNSIEAVESSAPLAASDRTQNAVVSVDALKEPEPEPKSESKQQVAFNEDLAKAAEQVAMQYENALKFPPYSQPLSPLDEDRLKPNKFYPVSSPIGEKAGSLSVSLSQYRFIYPQEITLKVSAKGLGKVLVELTNTDTKEVLNTYKGSARQGEAVITFEGKESYPRNLQLFVEANVANKKVPVVAQIQYMSPSATLTGFDNAYAQNENMIMPANLTILKDGLYRVRANLYDGNIPIAHLVAKERLTKGNEKLNLKAHWSVLPPGISEMRLSDFVIEKMSPSPGELNGFGNSDIIQFHITYFAYDSLQQLPYQASAQEMLNLEFLQVLAQN